MQMISEHSEMLELFDQQRNDSNPEQISVKSDNKYWFTIEGHDLLVSPRTVKMISNFGMDFLFHWKMRCKFGKFCPATKRKAVP